MMFTDEEALGLALGLLAARRLRLAGVAPAVEGALAKLERVILEDVRGRVQALQETVSIAVALPAATARSEALLALSAAADERRMVRLRYRSGRAEETEQEVDPYERWSVEVLLETGVEEVRGRLPPVGLSLERTEGGTLLRCSTWSLGWMARAGRPGVPFRRAGPKRAQGDARATRRGDFRPRQAHGTDLLMNEADTQESSGSDLVLLHQESDRANVGDPWRDMGLQRRRQRPSTGNPSGVRQPGENLFDRVLT
jgi:hypothetical protein